MSGDNSRNCKSERGHRTLCHSKQNDELDLTLAILCVRFRGQPVDYREISRACGMSHAGAFAIGQRALKKLRLKLKFGAETKTGREIAA